MISESCSASQPALGVTLCSLAMRPSMVRSAAVGRVSSRKTTKVSTRTATNTRPIRNMALTPCARRRQLGGKERPASRLHLLGEIQQLGVERYSRSLQLLSELGHDTGGAEAAQHLTVGTEPAFLEAKDVLHADDLFAHARDLRHVRDAARAVAHARDLQ